MTYSIIDAAIEVHEELGPGLLESLHPIHDAQLLTYMKLLDMPKGILINFNCTNIFKNGQKTLVTQRFSTLPKGY